jgi:hypothetical protein
LGHSGAAFSVPADASQRRQQGAGRRNEPQPTRENLDAIQKLALDLRGPRRLLVPKGVYRFKSHEEADEWLMKMLSRQLAPQ